MLSRYANEVVPQQGERRERGERERREREREEREREERGERERREREERERRERGERERREREEREREERDVDPAVHGVGPLSTALSDMITERAVPHSSLPAGVARRHDNGARCSTQ